MYMTERGINTHCADKRAKERGEATSQSGPEGLVGCRAQGRLCRHDGSCEQPSAEHFEARGQVVRGENVSRYLSNMIS
jgi:hypothetical protein